jgi:uncharacterized membrane protein
MGVLIIMNNYLHDLASAVLLSSAVLGFIFLKEVKKRNSEETLAFFIASYHQLTYLAVGSLVWIILGGIIRTLAFTKYEWQPAVGANLVIALVFKHIIIFTAVFFGIYLWRKFGQEVRRLKQAVS